jgi:glycosyltransferase involved in cell wall biosynthesis
VRVDLVCVGTGVQVPDWPLGEACAVDATPRALDALAAESLARSVADAWLFWDLTLGAPDPDRVQDALRRPGDLWHAGLRLGTAGLPALIDTVAPTWMLNRDPDPAIEATSWRVSLRACLVRTDALRRLGFVRPQFATMTGAALEMGHRFVAKGALTRHFPTLVTDDESVAETLPFEDELRFVHYRFGSTWSRWAMLRAVLGRYASVGDVRRASRSVHAVTRPAEPEPYAPDAPLLPDEAPAPKVTALIPTVDRYPYLRTLLDQLRVQTVAPADIIVIDQTAKERRDTAIATDYADLPLRVLYQDNPGQCTSRNAGLEIAAGERILFVDDDDEVQPTLIEDHLRAMRQFRSDVSCGVADEVGAGPLPANFQFRRAADVFPTNNTLASREVLQRSGLFDLAYNRGQRADRDLGMRVYLSGAVMILYPAISVLHHHAPAGGLRMHKARVITYASSRSKLVHRQLPSVTELYLAQRYFTPRQLRESIWLSVLGTFSVRGGKFRKLLKVGIGVACLPNTLLRIRKCHRVAVAMMRDYPQIPEMPSPRDE